MLSNRNFLIIIIVIFAVTFSNFYTNASNTTITFTVVNNNQGSGNNEQSSGGVSGSGSAPSQAPIEIPSSVNVTGYTSPNSQVFLLKDGQQVATSISSKSGKFTLETSSLSEGNYSFFVYVVDNDGLRSSYFTFQLGVSKGTNTTVAGILAAPTIEVDKAKVKWGDPLAIYGSGKPDTAVEIVLNRLAGVTVAASDVDQQIFTTTTNNDGKFFYELPTLFLQLGQYTLQVKLLDINSTVISKAITFSIGSKNVEKATTSCEMKSDLNNDCLVNLVDFSIAAFWYKKVLSSEFSLIEARQLNGDGQINIIDFSMMAFYWTG
jgi:hypothetical protein